MEFVALIAPWILLLLIISAILMLTFKRWKIAVSLMVLAIAGNLYFEAFPFHVFNSSSDKEGLTLTVLAFNCNLSHNKENREGKRSEVKAFVKEQNADVVFLTENFINNYDSLWLMLQEKYPYRVQEKNSVGNALYSKYPILTDTIYQEKGKGYGITCCQIKVRDERINVVGVHLSSNNYNEHNVYMTPDSVGNSEQARLYLGNIKNASKYREKEAELINVNFNYNLNGGKLRVPAIVMGDFNDVCGSPTINMLETAGLKNAWWEGGFGYGATIHSPLPYRIDHILYNESLELRDIKKLDAHGLSDHDALVGSFIIK